MLSCNSLSYIIIFPCPLSSSSQITSASSPPTPPGGLGLKPQQSIYWPCRAEFPRSDGGDMTRACQGALHTSPNCHAEWRRKGDNQSLDLTRRGDSTYWITRWSKNSRNFDRVVPQFDTTASEMRVGLLQSRDRFWLGFKSIEGKMEL